MTCGIYCIKNKINNKKYIGQSVDIKKRFREHCFATKHKENKDHNMPIHLAISKYGIENFELTILEECSKEELNNREIYWIKKYNSYKKGYNATIGGREDHRHLGTPVELYDFNGKFIKEYDNATLAAEALGVSRNTIYQILYGERLSTKGFQIKKKNDNKIIHKYNNKQGGKIPVYQLSLQGELIKEWESATQAARELNFDASTITKCCKGKLQTHKGFKWRYVNG